MTQIGRQIGTMSNSSGAEDFGLSNLALLRWNDDEKTLFSLALERGEGIETATGNLAVETGKHTGRSATDKFIVRDSETESTVWWDNNQAMSEEHFDTLYADFLKHAEGKELFGQDLYGGADPDYRIGARVFLEYAWHALFIRHLLRRPELSEIETYAPDMTIINLPSFRADPARHGCRSETVIAVSFTKKTVLIGCTSYGGENKKSIFGVMNYVLPEKGIMPMHCSANHATGDPDDSAVFFGLSGTGKTTLSADPKRTLLGDDEHGWSDSGIFNFEGGCYAKTINLRQEAEPEIYATCSQFGSVLENVVMDPVTRELDFDDGSLTQNTRVCYPLDMIPNASKTSVGGVPKNIVMLTCDAFGVLPPIARLTPAQAEYHFLSGFTAKVAGTEKGVTDPEPTFSTCFGAPFMPRRPSEYGNLLKRKIAETGATCWLVNTGWTGGAHGVGSRMPILVTRTLLTAALNGSLNAAAFRRDPFFGFDVPEAVPDVSDVILNPRRTWDDPAAYDAQARKLVQMFIDNFAKYEADVAPEVMAAGPTAA